MTGGAGSGKPRRLYLPLQCWRRLHKLLSRLDGLGRYLYFMRPAEHTFGNPQEADSWPVLRSGIARRIEKCAARLFVSTF
jgi:hypothetical protein